MRRGLCHVTHADTQHIQRRMRLKGRPCAPAAANTCILDRRTTVPEGADREAQRLHKRNANCNCKWCINVCCSARPLGTSCSEFAPRLLQRPTAARPIRLPKYTSTLFYYGCKASAAHLSLSGLLVLAAVEGAGWEEVRRLDRRTAPRGDAENTCADAPMATRPV